MQYPYSIPQSNCGGPPPYFTYQYPCSYYPNVSYFPRKSKRKTKQKYYIDDSSDEDDYCPRPNYYPNACTPNNPYPIIPMSPMNPFYPFPQQSYYPNYGTYPFSEDKKSKSKKIGDILGLLFALKKHLFYVRQGKMLTQKGTKFY